MVKSYHHDRLPLFGAGKDHGPRFWMAVIHQGLILHFLEKDIDNYGLISVTDKGREFYAHPTELMLVEDRTFSEGEDDDEEDAAAVRGGGGGDPVLLSMLKDLRKDVARKMRVQPWVVFSDPSLEDMTIVYPLTLKELSEKCQGVGEGKARKFGQPFIDLIAKYVEENEIDRPDDFVLKSVASKSGNKVYIIQAIDRKLPLDDIGRAKGLDMDELLTELEAIVSTGTRLNLSYYIADTLDPEVVEELYDWFKEDASSDSLSEARKELSADYEDIEIRLVRLKFLCEVAN